MKLIAHGGYSAKYPENTKESYFGALEHNPDGIEMDVVLFDRELYCYHPKKVLHNFGDDVDQAILTELDERDDLDQIRFSNFAVKLLEDVSFLLLDLKQKNLDVVPKVIDYLLSKNFGQDRIVIGARDLERMSILEKYKDKFKILSLSHSPDDYKEFVDQGVSYVRLWEKDVDIDRIKNIHSLGAGVWVTPGQKRTPTQPRTAGEATLEKLKEFEKSGVDAVLVNDIKMVSRILF